MLGEKGFLFDIQSEAVHKNIMSGTEGKRLAVVTLTIRDVMVLE